MTMKKERNTHLIKCCFNSFGGCMAGVATECRLDMWKQKKQYALELYLQGKSPAIISGLTGVPRIRIERELNRLTQRRPEFELIHLLANKLGNYEDLGTIEELKALKEATK